MKLDKKKDKTAKSFVLPNRLIERINDYVGKTEFMTATQLVCKAVDFYLDHLKQRRGVEK